MCPASATRGMQHQFASWPLFLRARATSIPLYRTSARPIERSHRASIRVSRTHCACWQLGNELSRLLPSPIVPIGASLDDFGHSLPCGPTSRASKNAALADNHRSRSMPGHTGAHQLHLIGKFLFLFGLPRDRYTLERIAHLVCVSLVPYASPDATTP